MNSYHENVTILNINTIYLGHDTKVFDNVNHKLYDITA